MKENFLLWFTDDTLSLYRRGCECLCTFRLEDKACFSKIGGLLASSPKTPCSFVIDRVQQDIQEEKLPRLFLWDRLLFLLHKKKEWEEKGRYGGFRFLSQEKETYFRWVYLARTDPLVRWLRWIKSVPNPFAGLFFAPLEAGAFLEKHDPTGKKYSMLIYPSASSQKRHVVFKGKRLLLSRFFEKEEEIRRSLHYLSRSYPDINENVHILNLVKTVDLNLSNLQTLSAPEAFLSFLSTKKKPVLSVKPTISFLSFLLQRGGACLVVVFLLLASLEAYEGAYTKRKGRALLPFLFLLRTQAESLQNQLGNRDTSSLKAVVEGYEALKSSTKNPLMAFQKMSFLAQAPEVRLEKVEWTSREEIDLVLSFVAKKEEGAFLVAGFNKILSSLSKSFPKGHIQVIEAPLHSGSHEEFKSASQSDRPAAHIKVRCP